MKALARTGLLVLYSLCFDALLQLLTPFAQRHRRLAGQLSDRLTVPELTRLVVADRNKKRRCAIFHCSSAGEFEQARPLMDRLTRRGDTYVLALFFSRSGLDFARARGETSPLFLMPLTDSVFAWGHFMTALRPDVVAIVRYELWPGFIAAAKAFAHLDLIDASKSLGEGGSILKRWWRRQLLGRFDRIHAVSAADAAFFVKEYGLDPARVGVAGDTKFDRVKERADAKAEETAALAARFSQVAPGCRRLVLGSAHLPDVETWLKATEIFADWGERWVVIVVPHHVDPDNLNAISSRCREKKIPLARWSALETTTEAVPRGTAILFDAMGRLAEVYGACDAAFVGGSMHHQVHNVLEPAVRGLALAFGPFYKNSQEAISLVDSRMATVVPDGALFAAWWRGIDANPPAEEVLAKAIAGLTGASDRILATWDAALAQTPARHARS